MATVFTPEFLSGISKRIEFWANQTEDAMLFQLARLDLRETGELIDSVEHEVLKDFRKFPDTISYTFAEQGFFQEFGIGRGTTLKRRKSNSRRTPQKWITSAINRKAVDELANIISTEFGDELLRNIQIGAFVKV